MKIDRIEKIKVSSSNWLIFSNLLDIEFNILLKSKVRKKMIRGYRNTVLAFKLQD